MLDQVKGNEDFYGTIRDFIVRECEAALETLQQRAERMEVETLLSGEADANDAFIEVHAGAGGTESQDWASMLARMYTRWAEKSGFKVEVIEAQAGEEGDIEDGKIEEMLKIVEMQISDDAKNAIGMWDFSDQVS